MAFFLFERKGITAPLLSDRFVVLSQTVSYAMPYLEYKKLLESTQSMWIQEPKPK
jgi:hypothetical protein